MIPLLSDMVFVFGSNLAGRHGAGAALEALKRGYPMNLGSGMMVTTPVNNGPVRCYGIPTKDCEIMTLPLHVVSLYVLQFKQLAEEISDLNFQVTRIGCGLAGFKNSDIAPLFIRSPTNCWFDDAWRRFLPTTYNFWGTYG